MGSMNYANDYHAFHCMQTRREPGERRRLPWGKRRLMREIFVGSFAEVNADVSPRTDTYAASPIGLQARSLRPGSGAGLGAVQKDRVPDGRGGSRAPSEAGLEVFEVHAIHPARRPDEVEVVL